MKLEDQVCSLESAKHLKELNVKQESLFYWNDSNHGYWELDKYPLPADEKDWCSAFTVVELGEMIGKKMLETYRDAGRVILNCYGLPEFNEPTEAEARAKMLIYLLENKLISP